MLLEVPPAPPSQMCWCLGTVVCLLFGVQQAVHLCILGDRVVSFGICYPSCLSLFYFLLFFLSLGGVEAAYITGLVILQRSKVYDET